MGEIPALTTIICGFSRRAMSSASVPFEAVSISQPVRRLRGFERVTLQPGQTKTVSWRLGRNDVGYYNNRDRFIVENGRINVFAGNTSSEDDNRASFVVTGGRRPELETSKKR